MKEKIMEIRNLKVYYPIKSGIFLKIKGYIKAVDGVNLEIYKGESFGLVGESGSGKSTLARAIVRIIPVKEGEILYKNKNILTLKKDELQKLREKIQIVFQNPFSSLNPRKTVGNMLMEPLIFHKKISKNEAPKKVFKILDIVGLPKDSFYRYPHEFSGGQRQRISIARALILNPEFIILDEPVSSLDVSIQAQILNLLKELQKEFKLTYFFISHNLDIVRFFCNRIAVMYLGKIMEIAETEELFKRPIHFYTKLLLDSVPRIGKKLKIQNSNFKIIEEIDKKLLEYGCRFKFRCNYKKQECEKIEPPFKKIGKNHFYSCIL